MTVAALLLIGGLIVLVYGANLFIDTAAELANRIGVPEIIIGLTLVAFGTSLPEWISSLFAALRDPALVCPEGSGPCSPTDLALGNVIGSNIANIGLVVGVAGLIGGRITVTPAFLKRDVPLMIWLSFLTWYFCINQRLLNPLEGGFMFLLFMVITYKSVIASKNEAKLDAEDDQSKDQADDQDDAPGRFSVSKFPVVVSLCVLGLTGLIVGSNWLVEGAQTIAIAIGIPEGVVGTTIVAFGTSVPELASSIAAVRKHKHGLLLGGIIGSNIANTGVVLATVALLVPVPVVDDIVEHQLPLMVFYAMILWVFMLSGKIERWQSAALLIGYIAFTASLFF